jgi:hypothetical protein
MGLKSKNWEKLESTRAIERRRPAIKRTSARAPKARINRSAIALERRRLISAIERTRSAIESTCA